MWSFSLRKATFLSFLFLFISNVFGQQYTKDIAFYFELDTIDVNQGKTFNNYLVIKNLTDRDLNIVTLEAEKKYPGLLLSPKTPSVIAAGKEHKLFVKFIATTEFMKMESDDISFNLSYQIEDGAQKTEKATFLRKRKIEEDIYVYPFARENYIDPTIPESTISIFVENTGYASRSIQLEFESNFGGITLSPRQKTINLEGKEKQLIELKLSIRQQSSYFPDYNIQIKAIDLISNKEVNTSNLKIIVLSNNTQVMRNQNVATDKNYMEMAYNQMGNGFDYMQLKANSEIKLGNQVQAKFNTAVDYYLNQDTFSMYNTYLEVERKGSSVKLGNIYGNDYDFSVSGRGAKLVGNLGSHKNIEVLAVDDNYNIYSNYISESEGSKTIATKYSFGDHNGFNGKVSYLFDHDPLSSLDSQLAHYNSAFKLNTNHNFRVEAGVSHEKGLINHKEQAGLSTSVNYDYRQARWEFNSLNSFATKNYAGMNRGAFNLYQNIGYRLPNNKRLFLQYQNSQSEPEYMYNQDAVINPNIFNNFYSTHSVKSGIQFSKNKWNFHFSPQVEKQKNISNFINEGLLSYRFRSTIGTSLKAHSVDLSAEYSYSEASESEYTFSSLKTMLTYRFKGFSLNGTAQFNPNNINDLNYYSEASKDYINFSLYSSYSFRGLQKNITGNISAGLNYSELYNNMNQNINANLEYKITPSWAGTAYANYSNYESLLANSFKGHNYQFSVGIKKYFTNAGSGDYHTVDLQFFEDKNLNGALDKGELLLANEIIKLDNYIAKTDKNGKVRFKNVPKGSYRLRVNESAGLRLMNDPIILVSKSINFQLGLGKNNKVKGKLIEIKQEYDGLNSDVRGIVVYAEDEAGHKTYTAVNQDEEFEFFLKNGSYRIFIENQRYEYLKPSQIIQLDNADYSETLIFEYVKKDRQIKVKKF